MPARPAVAARARARRTRGAAPAVAQPEVEVAQQPLIAALAILGHAFAICARELHVSLERRHERREVVVGARALPALLAVGLRTCALDGKLVGDAARALPVAARQAHDVAIQLIERRASLAASISSSQSPISLAVARSCVRRASVPSCCARAGRALGGHHHELIPAAQHPDRGEIGELGHATTQLLEGLHRLEGMHGGARAAARPRASTLCHMEPTSATDIGGLVKVAGGGPELDGIVFDVPSRSKVIVAVVDGGRGPVLRTVHPKTLSERAEGGPDDRALRLLIRRTPPPVRGSANGAAGIGAWQPRPYARDDAPHDRQVARRGQKAAGGGGSRVSLCLRSS